MQETLISFCKTEKEKAIISNLENGMKSRESAKDLGFSKSSVNDNIKRVKDRAALQGYSPEHDMDKTAPDTHIVKGVSTLYKGDKKVLQWVKTNTKLDDQYKVMKEMATALTEGIPHAKPVIRTSDKLNDQLLNAYFITDFHLGMFSWEEESGVEWDSEIAEQLLVDWFASAIKQSPDSKEALFVNIADFLHFDGMSPVTPAHGHVLDADTRYQNLIRIAIRAISKIIGMLLEKHETVRIISASGNHDPSSGAWLREMFSHYYLNDDRVTVDNNPDVYYAYEFGNNAIFVHHGDKRRIASVDTVFAAKFREIYGRTKFAYGHLGHLHSKAVVESNLMILEQHQTLAAPDAYAVYGGWMSQRSAQVITYHKEFGEVGRLRITPQMLERV